MELIKYVKRQDSGLKLSSGNSGETSLNLSNDIFDFISKGGFPNGEEREISFKIFKEDCVKAICFIVLKLPLYKTSSQSSTKVDDGLLLFSELLKEVSELFGENDSVDYTVTLFHREDGRIYLRGLRIGKFSIRDFLVENHSALLFSEIEGKLHLRILSNITEESGQNSDVTSTLDFPQSNYPLQQIYYGAPGTGKSHTINEITEKQPEGNVFRTTFHPDSDYSTFVGYYKPSMKPTGVTLASGEKDEVIKYAFIPQAFTKAYVAAWKTTDAVYLVIEEINRGNCAQIFGDLFQLLDRKNGVSEYPIDADSDLADHICNELKNSARADFPTGVKEGRKLALPSNLHIWATMNTSDQSLFPIDSAFKRRWEWKYVPIANHQAKGYRIKIGETHYDWWGFLSKINKVIGDTTSSEDKKMGYFFAKANGGLVDADQFVGKVLFYIWNDVFKNYGFDNPIFSKGDNIKFEFADFFTPDGNPDTEMVKAFLDRLDKTIDAGKSFTEKEETDSSAPTTEPSGTES